MNFIFIVLSLGVLGVLIYYASVKMTEKRKESILEINSLPDEKIEVPKETVIEEEEEDRGTILTGTFKSSKEKIRKPRGQKSPAKESPKKKEPSKTPKKETNLTLKKNTTVKTTGAPSTSTQHQPSRRRVASTGCWTGSATGGGGAVL